MQLLSSRQDRDPACQVVKTLWDRHLHAGWRDYSCVRACATPNGGLPDMHQEDSRLDVLSITHAKRMGALT